MSFFHPYGKGPGRFAAGGVSIRCTQCKHDVLRPRSMGYAGTGLVCERCSQVHYFYHYAKKLERVGDA